MKIILDTNIYISALVFDKKILELLDLCYQKDNKFLELAQEINSDYLITGDKDLLELQLFEHTKILKPNQFMTIYG